MALQTQIRLPAFVRTIDLQVPPEHQFSVHDLRWISIVEKRKHYTVAANPLDLEDFVCGEGIRGAAHVYCRDKGNNTAGILTSKIGVCFYGRLKGICQKKEATKTLAEACAANRRGKIAFGDSNKAGCQYGFTVKEFATRATVAIIKFASSEEEVLDVVCKSMGHCNQDGLHAHEGRVAHVLHTEAAKEIVIDRLKAGYPVKVVLDGVLLTLQQQE
jgi:hypothetical protein